MEKYNRNQLGPYRNSDQEWTGKLDRRKEDMYGEGDPNRKDIDPQRRPLTQPERGIMRTSPRNERIRNQRSGEYYGSPYDVGNYASHYDDAEYDIKDQPTGFRPEQQESGGKDFSGKGPRSYKRSDKRVLEDVNDRLYLDAYIDASDIEVEVDKGDVALKGTVKNRDAKRRAEDIAETVPGVKNVENRLRVANTNERIIGPVRSNARDALM